MRHICPQPRTLSSITPAKSRVICIASGKGGTGKTVVATNLSALLAKEGENVLLIDADMGLANAHLLLGASPLHDISQVLSGEKKVKDIIIECSSGVRLLPGGSGFSELADLKDWRFCYLARRFRELEEEFSLIFIDLPAGISPQVMRFLGAAHEVVIVTTPDITALMDAYATIKVLAKRRGRMDVKLIINRVRDKNDLAETFKKLRRIVEKHLEGVRISLFGWLSNNWYVQNSVAKRRPVVLLHPRSFATRCFHKMARQVKNRHVEWKKRQLEPVNREDSFFAKLEQKVFE